MKKLISLALVVILLGSVFVSCGTKDILTYKYNYDLSEYLELANYKDLPVECAKAEVTDEELEFTILSTLSYYAKNEEVSTPAVLGNYLCIDYTGTVDGKEFDGGSAKEYEFMLGTNDLFAEIDKALVGHVAGDTVTVELTLPEDYESEDDVAGKTAKYVINIHSVMKQVIPEYTDDFVRAYLKHDSIKDFENSLRESMLETKEKAQFQLIVSKTWASVIEKTNVKEYPKKEYDQFYNDMVSANKAYAEARGMAFSVFLDISFQMTEEEFYEYVDEEVKARMKEEMIIYAIARAENLTMTEEEYKNRATEYAKEYYGYESLKEFEEVYDKEVIRQTLLSDMAHEVVANYAKVTISE